MTMPGTILSQLVTNTMPSKACALGHDLHRVGDVLARDQGVVHALVVHGEAVADADDVELQGQPAALLHAELDLLGDGALRCMWPGMSSLYELATPMMGRAASLRSSPRARKRERWGARAGPAITSSLRLPCGTSSLPIRRLPEPRADTPLSAYPREEWSCSLQDGPRGAQVEWSGRRLTALAEDEGTCEGVLTHIPLRPTPARAGRSLVGPLR